MYSTPAIVCAAESSALRSASKRGREETNCSALGPAAQTIAGVEYIRKTPKLFKVHDADALMSQKGSPGPVDPVYLAQSTRKR